MFLFAMFFFVLSFLLIGSTYILWELKNRAKKENATLRQQYQRVEEAEAYCEQHRQRAVAFQKQCADAEESQRKKMVARKQKYADL